MGQRLIITIKDNTKNLAKAYYHWSGYTDSGLETAIQAINNADYASQTAIQNVALMAISQKPEKLTHEQTMEKAKILTACKMLFFTNAGMETSCNKGQTKSELDIFKETFPSINHTIGVNRNDGLIAITDYGMTQLQKWSETNIVINIETRGIDVSDLFYKCKNETINSSMVSLDEFESLYNIPFDKFPEFVTKVTQTIKNQSYHFLKKGIIYEAIK